MHKKTTRSFHCGIWEIQAHIWRILLKTHILDKNHVAKQEKSSKLLKKYSRGPAVPFVSMIIFENHFFVEMMQYIKKGDRNLL